VPYVLDINGFGGDMNKNYAASGPMAGHHANPPAPFNPSYDSNAAARYERVTASMVADDFYSGHTREECKAEWARRYDADQALTGTAQNSGLTQFEISDGKLRYDLEGSILEVIEQTSPDKKQHWYYDIEQWLVSSHGKQGDVPDRPMTESGIDWVRKHYLPHVDVSSTLPPKI
jgi:hypothetical protein